MAKYWKVKPEAHGHMIITGNTGRTIHKDELFTIGEVYKYGFDSFPEDFQVIEASQKSVVYVLVWGEKYYHGRNRPVECRYLPEDRKDGHKHPKKQPETLAQYLGRKLLPPRTRTR